VQTYIWLKGNIAMASEEISVTKLREALSKRLGTEVPLSVAMRAFNESAYCYHLIASRTNPLWLSLLFSQASSAVQVIPSQVQLPISSSVTNFVSSIIHWASDGFKTVNHTTFLKRWTACQECPSLVDPPKHFLYHLGRKIMGAKNGDHRVCSACGCLAYSKAKITTESCPMAHPSHPQITRWFEQMM